jgi:hypothetical protein
MVSLDIETVLRNGGYRCRMSPYDQDILLFEDDSIFGFVVLYDTVERLLATWKEKQTHFIQKNAGTLRRANMKAWNCYAVFLSSEIAHDEQRPSLADIEEDLSLTRKLVADGVSTQRDAQRALLPVLPIQNHAVPSSDLTLNLSTRLDSWSVQAVRALEGDATATELLEILWDTQ